tara:strand:- start:1499 stop:1657 length:159 start_codon:yes stop_codon:yes gene_type:complete
MLPIWLSNCRSGIRLATKFPNSALIKVPFAPDGVWKCLTEANQLAPFPYKFK